MKKQTEIIKPFKIEKGIVPSSRGRRSFLPKDYYRVQATMAIMAKEDSFMFPINGYKMSSIKGWIQRIAHEWASEIIDIELREKNKKVFSTNSIKDNDGKDIGVRIFRIA